MFGRSLMVILSTLISTLMSCMLVFAHVERTPTAPVDSLEAAKWREDLRFMAAEMPKLHKNLFHTMSKERFDGAVSELDKRIPTLARHQIVVELMRIVAMVGDGHTSLNPELNSKMGFRYYPIKLYLYSDGLFIQSADRKYEHVVGARLLKVGNTPATEAYKAVSAVVPRDNDQTLKDRVPFFMAMPEVLHGLGLISDMEKAPLLVEKDGKQTTVWLEPAGKLPQKGHGPDDQQDLTGGWVTLHDTSQAALPLWRKAPNDSYWFEYLADSQTLYVQYNSVFNKRSETIEQFFKRVFAFANAHPVERFVLDVRLNNGGQQQLNKPILLGLIKSEKINRHGHLFTIIGRGTFSAAQNLVNELERYTNTIFVGEPTGARVNFYGDHNLIELPNSGLRVAASSLWWQTMNPRDRRLWIAPRIATELSSADDRKNIDPAFNAILNYKSIVEALTPALNANDIALAVKLYRGFKADPRLRFINTEGEINALGYELLNMNKFDQAIEVFKLNVESYPRSANVYDSLGDAYSHSGNKELAIKSFEKALELDPTSEHTAEKLRMLRH